MKYRMTLSEKQVKVVLHALDLFFRLEMGQVEELKRRLSNRPFDSEVYQRIKSLLFPELEMNEYYGIMSPEISDDTRRAADIHDALRYHYVWSKEPNEPTERDWARQNTVYYDEPLPCLENEALPAVEVIDGNE